MVMILMNGVLILKTGKTYKVGFKLRLGRGWKILRKRKLLDTFIFCVCMACITASPNSFASEKPETSKTSHFSIGIGWETLNYREHEPDTRLDSEADVFNWTIGLDAFKRWTHIFCGFKGVIPVHHVDDFEEWRVSDILTQQNSLEYGWTRIDAFLGYRLKPFLNPYIGLRWSESKQERTEFVVLGTPVEGSATEEVTAWFITLGIRGDILLNSRWRLSYSGSYFEPISSEVENSNLPEWEVTDTDGYTLEFEGHVEYTYTDSISLVFKFYGGQMYWKGSEWAAISGRLVKWPENDTRYFGGMLNIKWLF
jgi:hypothetical protein